MSCKFASSTWKTLCRQIVEPHLEPHDHGYQDLRVGTDSILLTFNKRTSQLFYSSFSCFLVIPRTLRQTSQRFWPPIWLRAKAQARNSNFPSLSRLGFFLKKGVGDRFSYFLCNCVVFCNLCCTLQDFFSYVTHGIVARRESDALASEQKWLADMTATRQDCVFAKERAQVCWW